MLPIGNSSIENRSEQRICHRLGIEAADTHADSVLNRGIVAANTIGCIQFAQIRHARASSPPVVFYACMQLRHI